MSVARPLIWVLLLLSALPLRAQEPPPELDLALVRDRTIALLIPDKWRFENLGSKMFRHNDGRSLMVGPGPEKTFFIIQPDGSFETLEAPTTNKAYHKDGRFQIWYDALAEGIHFADGHHLRIPDPVHTRFGVSYDLDYYYLQTARTGRIYRTGEHEHPSLELDHFYIYKIGAWRDQLYVFGYSASPEQQVRSNVCATFLRAEDRWQPHRRVTIPDSLEALDLNPATGTILLQQPSDFAPQLLELELATGRLQPLTVVQSFGFYLHADFNLPSRPQP